MTGWLAALKIRRFPEVRLFLAAAMLSLFFAAGIAAAQDAQPPTREQIEALRTQVDANGDADALKQLEAMAESEPLAMAALGDIYAQGKGVPADRAKAAQYYENALSKGDKAVRTRLGLLYRDGEGLPANPSRALELLSEAAQGGDNWAMFHLAQGHLRSRFGNASRPAEGIKMLEQAMAAGNPQAAPALSNLYMWGNGGVRRDPKRAVALLEEAADKGNAVAARNLVAIYRDGRGKLIAKDPRRAAVLLDKYAALFDPAALATEKLLTESVGTTTSASRQALAESYINADPAARRRLIMSLRAGNPNAYVFLLQHRMKAAGKYNGNIDGRLNSTTIRAINTFCRSENISDACRHGPLSVKAANALADVLR